MYWDNNNVSSIHTSDTNGKHNKIVMYYKYIKGRVSLFKTIVKYLST